MPRSAWRIANVLVIAAGFVVFGLAMFGWGGSTGYMTLIDPRQASYGPSGASSHWHRGTLIHLAAILLGSGALAGLPAPRRTERALAGAIGQAAGGLTGAIAIPLGLAFVSLGFSASTEDVCRYASCWPMNQQYLLLSLPGIIFGLAMLTMAALVNRAGWWLRVLVPATTWLVGIGIQNWLHETWLLPLFLRGHS